MQFNSIIWRKLKAILDLHLVVKSFTSCKVTWIPVYEDRRWIALKIKSVLRSLLERCKGRHIV